MAAETTQNEQQPSSGINFRKLGLAIGVAIGISVVANVIIWLVASNAGWYLPEHIPQGGMHVNILIITLVSTLGSVGGIVVYGALERFAPANRVMPIYYVIAAVVFILFFFGPLSLVVEGTDPVETAPVAAIATLQVMHGVVALAVFIGIFQVARK